jgi:hypothetical protein
MQYRLGVYPRLPNYGQNDVDEQLCGLPRKLKFVPHKMKLGP